MQDQIDEIMDNFDFHKVQRVMEFMDWTWMGEPPGAPALRKRARSLLKEVVEKDRLYAAQGGLRAEHMLGRLRLSFVLECWDAGDE